MDMKSKKETEVPERIWAFAAPEIAENEGGATIVAHEDFQRGAVEYVRADLHDATKAKLAKAVEALTVAANRLAWATVKFDTGTKNFITVGEWADEARIVLAEIEKGEQK